ncbi:carbohydrate kinase family protein [Streptomyces sasae]|uniref:carbohydrate kinase family protein n=1 Tax=Streptomyces sasae TaxID=1266772 RepID=UPI002930E0F2|nr:PfkB family carbohydrate kinase [Streptomyces sasae]
MVDVLFAGEVFCDLVFAGIPHLPTPGGEVYADRFAVVPGGTATRSVAAARLGLHTGLFAVIGTDFLGDHLVTELAREQHLDLSWLRRDPTVQTPVTVAATNEHDRTFITYEEEGARRPQVWDGELPDARFVQLTIGRPLPGWVSRLRAEGTRVVGGVGWDPTGRWSPELLTRLAEVDVFICNAVEATSYTRTGTVEEAVKVLDDLVADVVVTDGPRGAVAVDGVTGELVRIPAPSVPAVDPTGAGDVFTAAFIAGLSHGWPLTTRLRFAGLCAALSVRSLGGAAGAPHRAAVDAFLTEISELADFTEKSCIPGDDVERMRAVLR